MLGHRELGVREGDLGSDRWLLGGLGKGACEGAPTGTSRTWMGGAGGYRVCLSARSELGNYQTGSVPGWGGSVFAEGWRAWQSLEKWRAYSYKSGACDRMSGTTGGLDWVLSIGCSGVS